MNARIILPLASLVLWGLMFRSCNHSAREKPVSSHVLTPRGVSADSGHSEASGLRDTGSVDRPPIWDKYTGDTALAVKILAAVYERQWSFYERKGGFARQVQALQRPYVTGPPLPELPQGWSLTLPKWDDQACGPIGVLMTRTGVTYSLRPALKCKGRPLDVPGHIDGPGVKQVPVLRPGERKCRGYGNCVYDCNVLGSIGVYLTGYLTDEVVAVTQNPITIGIVDGDGDSTLFAEGHGFGFLDANDVGGVDDISERDDSGRMKWGAMWEKGAFAGSYALTFRTVRSMHLHIDINGNHRAWVCEQLQTNPDENYMVRFNISQSHQLSNVNANFCVDKNIYKEGL